MGCGRIIKRILQERGMSIKKLAEVSGVSVNTLYSITKRDSSRIEPETINRIASALGVQPFELSPMYEDMQRHEAEQSEKRKQLHALLAEFYGDSAEKLLSYCNELNAAGREKWFERAEELLELPRYSERATEYQANGAKDRPEYFGADPDERDV